jgi:hypothetical protein
MSVDGWSEGGGTPRLFCLDPPGGDGGAESSFHPNVFLGYRWPVQPASPAMVTVAPGAGDFSFEIWGLVKPGNLAVDGEYVSGIVNAATERVMASIGWSAATGSVIASFSALGLALPGPIETAFHLPDRVGLWNHFAVNFDRDGNMELFIDTVSKETIDISAQADAVTGELHPLTIIRSTDPFHDTTLPPQDFGDLNSWPVVVGPVAIHDRLMTTAEIEDSFHNKKVQTITGTSLVTFNWSDIKRETGWDTNWDNMMWGFRNGLHIPAAAPQGPVGTVFVVDTSGNRNDWTLPTVADYTTYDAFIASEDGYWPIAFGADPFFR